MEKKTTIAAIKHNFYQLIFLYRGISKKEGRINQVEDFICRLSDEERRLVNDFIFRLCDSRIKVIASLNEEETYLLRKKLGVLDYDGFKGSKEDVFHITDKSYYYLNNKMPVIMSRLFHYFPSGSKKMSSVTDKYRNYNVSCLHLNPTIDNLLIRNGIYTLEDLLSYSKRDLLQMREFGQEKLNVIVSAVHALGLKFIDDDDFTMAERYFAVYNADKDTIFSSSLDWIRDGSFNPDKIKKQNKSRACQNIDDFYSYTVDGKVVSQSTLNAANLIGIDSKLSDDFVSVDDYDSTLSCNLLSLGLNKRLSALLECYSIYTLGDLISLTKEDLESFLYDSAINDLIYFVHTLGYFLRDERPQAKKYASEIVRGLSRTLTLNETKGD